MAQDSQIRNQLAEALYRRVERAHRFSSSERKEMIDNDLRVLD
jgi:hypothetical protein